MLRRLESCRFETDEKLFKITGYDQACLVSIENAQERKKDEMKRKENKKKATKRGKKRRYDRTNNRKRKEKKDIENFVDFIVILLEKEKSLNVVVDNNDHLSNKNINS